MDEIKVAWTGSKIYRMVLVIAIIYALFRLAAQVYFAIEPFQSEAVSAGQQVSSDLQIYITAAQHFYNREDLYLQGSLKILEQHYPYSPAFALMFMPILLLPLPFVVGISFILHIVAYGVLYIWWGRIFRQNGLARVARLWAQMLPLYLVFAAFWDDLSYLNIYIIIALFATLLIDAVLREDLGWSVFWLGVVILPIKPHWAFAVVIPLLLGRYRFFGKLLLGTLVAYFAVAGITILAGGISYGVQQYTDYIGFLARLSRDFPWRGPGDPFLGYNHSVMQIILYYFGVSATNMKIATLIKVILLLPLALLSLNYLMRRLPEKAEQQRFQTGLELAFAFYLGTFIWLDMVWEVSLGMPVFIYLLATLEQKWKKILAWVVFFPYVFIDFWRLCSYIIFGDAVLYEGSYVLSDPLIYIPVLMIILLVFYALLLERLWSGQAVAKAVSDAT